MNMSENDSETVEISRRTFMSGTATALGASAGLIGTATAMPSNEAKSFNIPGNPSRKAERVWAEHEYRHYKRMREIYEQQDGSEDGPGIPTNPKFTRTLNAVKDIGCDPTGHRPISDDLDASHMQDGTLIVFPPGKYRVTSRFSAAADGTFGMVGAGYRQASGAPKPGKQTTTFVAPSDSRAQINFTATTGIFANIVLDQRNQDTSIGIVVATDGFAQIRDVRVVGWQDNTGSVPDVKEVPMCALRATNESATVRAERVVGRYVGKPGTKESGGAPFFWVGTGNKGTAQMGHCTVSGAADNASYSSRTPGNAQIKGGSYVNNVVTQSRISGLHSWVDGATIIFDANSYKGPLPKKFNDVKGTWGVEIERGTEVDKPSGAVLRNLEIRTLSEGSEGLGAAIGVRGSGGAVKITNCRITNTIDCPMIHAEAPGAGYSGETAPPPHNVTVEYCLFEGTNAGKAISVHGRKTSFIRNSCISIPGATAENSIEGVRIGENVGFGKTCKGKAGLRAPKKVGSPGDLPPVSIPNVGRSPNEGNWIAKIAAGVMRIMGLALLFFVGIVGLVVLAISSLVGD